MLKRKRIIKKLLLCITIASLVNLSFKAYSIENGYRLMQAVLNNDIKAVKLLLKNHDGTYIGEKTLHPLYYANISYKGKTPLVQAVLNNNMEIVILLLKNNAYKNLPYNGKTPLHVAVNENKIEIIKLLLGEHSRSYCPPGLSQISGAIHMKDKNGQTPLDVATSKKDIEMVKLLFRLSHFHDENYFYDAIRSRNLETIKLFIANGANTNDRKNSIKNYTPLFAALYTENPGVVKLLLENGAYASVNKKNPFDVTPLYYAVSEAKTKYNLPIFEKIIRLLLQYDGADINSKNKKGKTALHCAVRKKIASDAGFEQFISSFHNTCSKSPAEAHLCKIGWHKNILANAERVWHKGVVKLLLDNGANPNIPDDNGCIPLHLAVKRNLISGNYEKNIKMINLLLRYNADPNYKNKTGKSPLDVAKTDEIKYILLRHTNPQKVQHIIPALKVLGRKKQKYWQPKEIRKMLRNYMIRSVVSDKLKKTKGYLPNYNEKELWSTIEESVIEAIKSTPRNIPI